MKEGVVMNETLRVLKERRSIRKYKKEQIKDEELNLILEAGTYAPSARGLQSPKIVVIQDAELIKKISKLNAQFTNNPDADPFFGAPTLLIVFADSNIPTYVEDGSLVMGNLMNAAFSLGVDSCWINRARQVFKTEEGQALLKEWGIESHYEGIGNCILGYRDCPLPSPKPRKEDYIVRV